MATGHFYSKQIAISQNSREWLLLWKVKLEDTNS